MLSKEQIAKFRAIYKARFGKEISEQEAYEMGVKLLRLVQLVHRPIKKTDFNKLSQFNKN